MTRKPATDDSLLIEVDPGKAPKRIGEDDWPDFEFSCNSSKEVREASPLQRGDVALVNFGAHSDPVPVPCLVLRVGTERLVKRNYIIPRYKVVKLTQAGRWSRRYQYVYPGFVL